MFKSAATVLLTLALAACSRTTPEQTASHPDVRLTTASGMKLGESVTQTITDSGGQVSVGGVVVNVPPGIFTMAHVTVQPITNTLSDGMQSVEISSDAPWSRYLGITMPIDKKDLTPGGLGIAVQQPDGSWLSLEPVEVDVTAGTVKSVLPAEMPIKQAGSAALNLIPVAQATESTTMTRRIAKFYRFYLEPASATVEITKSQDFTPYARVDSWSNCPASYYEKDPADLKCLQVVQEAQPFTNDKPGFFRGWDVNSNVDGNPLDGMIVERKPIGATYTAPDKVPSPDHVMVEFISGYEDKSKKNILVDIKAEVKITDPTLLVYKGTVELHMQSVNANQFFDNSTWDMHGEVTVRKDPSSTNSYPVSSSNMSGTFQKKDCTTVHSDFQLESDMQLHIPDTKGEPAMYGFDFVAKASDANQVMSCVGKDGAQLTVPVSMSGSSIGNHCETMEAMIESTSNPDLLEGSRTYTCPMGLPNQGYKATFKWNLRRQ